MGSKHKYRSTGSVAKTIHLSVPNANFLSNLAAQMKDYVSTTSQSDLVGILLEELRNGLTDARRLTLLDKLWRY